MDAQHKPSRFGYCYRKTDRPANDPQRLREDRPSFLRFRLFGMHWRALPLYRRAGSPFGDTDAGLLLWLEFGRRTYGN